VAAERLDLGLLPLWRGPQERPGATPLPFVLGVEAGVVRLALPPAELARITAAYAGDGYGFITSPPGSSSWGDRLGEWYLEVLARRLGSLAGQRVVEIGSGTLYVAERLVERLGAARVTACDPALRQTPRSPAIAVERAYFGTVDLPPADLVVSLNTLEHVPDLGPHLRAIRRLLRPGGRLFLVVPDCSRGLAAGDVGICVHEHLSYFTPDSLLATLAANGLETTWHDSREDTIFAVARPAKPVAGRPDDRRPAALLARFGRALAANLARARQLLQTLERPLACHGCSVHLSNLFGLLGLEHDPSITLFDGDERKVGRYLPTFDRPIRSARDPSYRRMASVVVAAMTYYREIAEGLGREHGIPPARIHPILPSGGPGDD